MLRLTVTPLLLCLLLLPAFTRAQTGEAHPEIRWLDSDEPELRDGAATLGTPTAIYEFVRNEFRYQLYHGSRSSSINTYLARSGNDVDIASTLIAMLRSRGIPARYAVATVRVDTDKIARWLGLSHPYLTRNQLYNLGIQNVELATDESTLDFEHAWVQALVAVDDYRGMGSATSVNCVTEPARCVWIDLDASFKDVNYSPGEIDIHDILTFDTTAYYDALIDSPTNTKNPVEVYEEQILTYLRANHPGKTLEDVATAYEAVKVSSGALPTSLPYAVVSTVVTHDSVAAHDAVSAVKWGKSVHLEFDFTAAGAPGLVVDGGTYNLADLSTRQLTVANSAYSGGYPQMQVRLDAELATTVLTIDNQVGVSLGDAFQITVRLEGPPSAYPGDPDTEVIATYPDLMVGGYFEVATGGESSNWSQVHRAARKLLAANQTYRIINVGTNPAVPYVDENQNGTIDVGERKLSDHFEANDALTGGLLYSAHTLYFARLRDSLRRIDELNHVVSPVVGFLGVVSTTNGVQYIDGTPFSVQPTGLLIDMGGLQLSGHWRPDDLANYSNKTAELAGITASALEHEVWEELTGYEGMSTVKAFQKARAAGIGLNTLSKIGTAETVSGAYPALGFSTSFGASSSTFDMFGARFRAFYRTSGVRAMNVVKAVVDFNSPEIHEEAPRFIVAPIAPLGQVNGIFDLLQFWDTLENTAIAQGWETWTDCLGESVAGSQAVLEAVEYCFILDILSEFGAEFGTQYLLYFDEISPVAPFISSEHRYRQMSTNSSPLHSVGFVAQRRNEVLLHDPATNERVEVVLPSRKTASTPGFYQGWQDRTFLLPTGWLIVQASRIAADPTGARGGYVSGLQTLRLWDPLVFENEFLTNLSLIATPNNDLFRAPATGDPISTVTGNMYHDERDFMIRGRNLDYAFTRTYNSGPTNANQSGLPMGHRWNHSYGMRLRANAHGQAPNEPDPQYGYVNSITYVDERGGEALFGVTGTGSLASRTITNPRGRFEELDLSDADSEIYVLRFRNGAEYQFGNADLAEANAVARLTQIRESDGSELNFTYDALGNLTAITDNLGVPQRTGLALEYFPDNRLRVVRDWTAREWTFTYDASGNLTSVTNPLLETKTYEYAVPASHELTSIVLPEDRNGASPGGQVRQSFDYYRNSKAFRNFDAYGNGETVDYDLYRRRTRITDPRGFVRSHVFDRDGQLTKLEEPDGGILLFRHTLADGLRFSKRDARGYETYYSYHRIQVQAECDTSSSTFCEADEGGNITMERDPIGGRLYYEYGARDQVTATTDKRGITTLRAYHTTNSDLFGRKSGKLDRIELDTVALAENTLLEDYRWNADGTIRQRREYIEHGNSLDYRQTDYTYEANSSGLNVERIRTKGSRNTDREIVRTFTYDPLGRMRTEKVRRRVQHEEDEENLQFIELTTTYEYDDLSRVTAVIDHLGNRRETEYDRNGKIRQIRELWKRPAPETGFDVRNVSTRFYDLADRVIEERDVLGKPTYFAYDPAGNLARITDANGSATQFEYDSMDRRTALIDANGHRTATVYDLAGNVVKTIDANGNPTIYAYDALNRLISTTNALGYRITTEYDRDGNPIQQLNANAESDPTQRNMYGATLRRDFDELNRVTRMYDAAHMAESGPSSSFTAYTYDLLGNLLTVTDAEGRVTTMTYDNLGGLVKIADPLSTFPDRVTTFVLDELGNVVHSVDRANVPSTFIYDELSRLRSAEWPETVTSGSSVSQVFTYDHRGDLMQASTDGMSYIMMYDEAHRLVSRHDVRGPVMRSTSWAYDNVGNVRTKTGYDGQITEYLYDSTNRLVALRNQDYLSVSYQYDAGGRLLNRILSNGAQTHYGYDAANRLVSLVSKTVAGTVESNVYGRDRVGNVISLAESVFAGAASFEYDKLHRLRKADYPNTANDRCYTYDRVGNRKTETHANVTNCTSGTPATPTYSYDHDMNNRVTLKRAGSGTTQVNRYGYLHTGQLFERRNASEVVDLEITYDLKGRVKGYVKPTGNPSTDLTYGIGYDPFDYRISKVTNLTGPSISYYLDGEHLDMVTDGSNQVLSRYMRGVVIDEVVNGYQRATSSEPFENLTWLHDATQSVTQTVEHTGATQWQERYLPFGEAILGTASSNFLRYTGREQDESGLYYYRARYYDPALGRFLSEDPIGFKGGINLYAYVENNPLISTDPFGWLTLILHGTFANGEAWPSPGSDFNAAVSSTFGEQAQKFGWSGRNNVDARTQAAQDLLKELELRRGLSPNDPRYWAPGEPLNIVAHSHGQNVIKEFTNLPGAPRIDTLVGLGGPQRIDYEINRGNVGRYISAYSTTDQVQVNGGPIWLGGAAGRVDPLAENINLGGFGILNPIDSHGMTHDADVWRNQIDPVITRYPSSGSSSSTLPYCMKGWCW